MGEVLLARFPRKLTRGEATIDRVEISKTVAMMSALSHKPGITMVDPGTYVRLFVNGQVTMSNTRMERWSNREVVLRSNGRVLIAGLGIGMILAPILERDEVREVVVIEKSPDVIALVEPKYRCAKLRVVEGDIEKWRPSAGETFDVIYFDIWPTIDTENLPQIASLHRRFARFLNRSNDKAWMGSWMADYLRNERPRERAGSWRWAM